MNKPLLFKNFHSQHEQIMLRIQTLQQKNNYYQRLNTNDLDATILREINEDKDILSRQIRATKSAIEKMENQYKQPHQRNKLKQTKREYEKQVQRFKLIVQNLIEGSVISKDSYNENPHQTKNPSKTSYFRNSVSNSSRNSISVKSIQIADKSEEQLERKCVKQRTDDFNHLQAKLERVNQIHNEISHLVNEQGQNIDIIGEQIGKAKANMVSANQELNQAAKNQKKSRKKYIILIAIILFIAVSGVALFLILTK